MNLAITHADTGERTEAEAAERWFVRMLDPACSELERAAFARWYTSDPAHARRYNDVQQLWAASEMAVNAPELKAEADAALHPRHARSRRWFVPAVAAASVALCALVAALGWRVAMHASPNHPTQYATATGQLRTVHLPDGSSMVLDTDSVASVDYRPRRRNVTLVRGRALFEVRHDAARPFQVHVGAGTVTDLGTVFQVSRDQQGAKVVLIRGSVSVAAYSHGAMRSLAMVPHQEVRIAGAGEISAPRKVSPAAVGAWTRGDVIANDWPLPRLIQSMNRYSTVKLVLGDATLANVRISGVFHTGDQQSLLRMLQLGWAIQAQTVSPREIVLTRAGASAVEAGTDRL